MVRSPFMMLLYSHYIGYVVGELAGRTINLKSWVGHMTSHGIVWLKQEDKETQSIAWSFRVPPQNI